jgi:hypothetical protein
MELTAKLAVSSVAEMAQKIAHHIVRNAVAEPMKLGRQIAQALGGPQQRRHGVAARRRLHQSREIAEQRRIGVHEGRAAGALPAHPTRRRLGLRLAAQFRQPATDRATRNTGDSRDGNNPATTGRQRFSGCKPTSPTLVQHRIERRIPQLDCRIINHTAILNPASHPWESPYRQFRFDNFPTGPKAWRPPENVVRSAMAGSN